MNTLGKTVLVLDDEVGFQKIFQELFAPTNHRVVAESNPRSALDFIRKNSVDLVVTDQQMPQMTGAEFIKTARQYRPKLAFIMISGQLDAPTTRDMIEAGIGGIFLKPLDTKAIFKCANALLEKKGLDQQKSSTDIARFN